MRSSETGRGARYTPVVDLEKLAAPFPLHDLEWRVVRLSTDKMSAQVRPQLRLEAVRRRLDEACGAAGWSNSFVGIGDGAVSCTLGVTGMHRSAVAARRLQGDPVGTAEDAFVYAAEVLGMRPPVSPAYLPWVDYNPESGEILFEPDLSELGAASEPPAAETFGVAAPSVEPREEASTPSSSPAASPSAPQEASQNAPKPAGQQAIDRLLERLKAEDLGLQAAKLVVQYGGYGSDPAAARELYAQLRGLLLSRPDPDEAA